MKVKISKSKAGETRIDYMKIVNKAQFRYCLLKKIIENYDNNVVLFVDTNQCIKRNSGLDILERLRQIGVEPMTMRIPVNREQFFGFQLNLLNKNDIEYMICLELKGSPFTEAMFSALSLCDIAVGINQTEPIISQFGLVGINPMLMLTTCFKNRIYDSLLYSRINSNFDIENYVGEIAHEMGI